jgi:TatD DNase family protein
LTEKPASIRPAWVDFHCHLDLYPDHATLIGECDRERIATLAVTTTPKAWEGNLSLASRSKMVRVGLGLHPQLVSERASEIELFEKLLADTRFVGEVGLDAGPRFYRSFEAQERVFARILSACSEQGNKVLSIHSIRAASKVLDHLDRYLSPDRGKCVLHWFTGSNSEAKRAIDYGCYFSINAEMLRSPKHRALVAKLPLDRLLTETDGPFVERNGRPLRPRDISATVNELAVVRGIPSPEMAKVILRNLGALLA